MPDLLKLAQARDFAGVAQTFRHELRDRVLEVAEYLREEDIYNLAIELYDHLLSAEETSIAHFGIGQCYGKIYDYARAASHLERAFALDPARQAGASYFAYILERLGRLDEAAPWYQRALAGPDGEDLWARSHYAWFLEKWGRPRDAAAAYEDVLARNPAYTWALKRYALLLRTQGEEERALGLLQDAVRRLPQNLFVRLNLVEFLLLTGRDEAYERESADARRLGGPPWAAALLDLFDYMHRHILAGSRDPAWVAAWEERARALTDSVHRDFDDVRELVATRGGDVEEWDRLVRLLLK